MEKSAKEHWEATYQHAREINPNWKPIYYDFRSIASVIERQINHYSPRNIFEIGCGDSLWLPYFIKKFNFEWGGGELIIRLLVVRSLRSVWRFVG